MKKNILIALIAAAAIAPVAAQAESYVGASIGRGEQKLTIDGVGSVKDHDTAYKFFGGYQFNSTFGIEAGWADLGKTEISGNGATVTAHPRSLYLAGTGTWPLAERFALTGKIGAARTRTTETATGESDQKFSNTSLLLGVGTTYAITPTVLAVVEYEHFGKVADEDDGNLKANVLSVGIRVKF